MPRKRKVPEFGSISSGTMRTQDLLDAFAPYCKEFGGKVGRKLAREYDRLSAWDDLTPEQRETAESILEEMFDCLNECAPPYGYFGAHPGNGADYGWWLHEDFQQIMRDENVMEVSDTGEIPKGYSGEVLQVSDHGNATLYYKSRNHRLVEVWSVV